MHAVHWTQETLQSLLAWTLIYNSLKYRHIWSWWWMYFQLNNESGMQKGTSYMTISSQKSNYRHHHTLAMGQLRYQFMDLFITAFAYLSWKNNYLIQWVTFCKKKNKKDNWQTTIHFSVFAFSRTNIQGYTIAIFGYWMPDNWYFQHLAVLLSIIIHFNYIEWDFAFMREITLRRL